MRSVTDYTPTAAELQALVSPLPPRRQTELEKAEAAIKAERILLQSAKDIANGLVDLALNASSEKVRLEASKYVIDRLAGRIPLTSQIQDNDVKQPWEDVVGSVFREPSKYELDGEIIDPK